MQQEIIVTRMLEELGFSHRQKGYRFARAAVLQIESGSLITVEMKQMYEKIAKKYATNAACVERNIRYSIECAWTNGDIEKIYEMFGYTVCADKGKPTNAEFLVMLADKSRIATRPAFSKKIV